MSRIDGLLRRALLRHARGGRRDGPETVTVLLGWAWGMGGTIRATFNFAEHLARSHDVEILSIVRRAEEEEPHFPLPPGVAVTAVDDRRDGPGGPLRRLLGRAPSVLVDPADRLHPDVTLWTDVALARRLRGRRGYVIGTRPALNIVAARVGRGGLVAIGQEQMHLRHHDPALRRSMRHAYPALDAMVVLTDRDARRYDRMLEGRVPLHRIPNTVRPNLGPPAPLDGTTVLAAGRLTNQKGFDLLVKAFARIAGEHPRWQLVICGEGPARPRLERIVARRGLEGRVRLPGPVEPLSEEMDRAAMFVLSSRFEGFPLVLLEAMAKGLPVVATRCPTGPDEIITDRADGLLVRPERVRALARGMAELMDDEDLRRRLGPAGASTAKAYTMEAVGPLWDALLDGLSPGGTAASASGPPTASPANG